MGMEYYKCSFIYTSTCLAEHIEEHWRKSMFCLKKVDINMSGAPPAMGLEEYDYSFLIAGASF
jgi:hypothetical protein